MALWKWEVNGLNIPEVLVWSVLENEVQILFAFSFLSTVI
jgi:hypothetical protein